MPADRRVLRRLAEFGLDDGDRPAHAGGALEPGGHLPRDGQPRRPRRAGPRRARAPPRPHRSARRRLPRRPLNLKQGLSPLDTRDLAALGWLAWDPNARGSHPRRRRRTPVRLDEAARGAARAAAARARASTAMLAAGLERVIVVLGHDADAIRARVDFGAAEVVVAEDWADGQAASLRRGLAAAGDADAVVITLGDQPFITPQVIGAALEQLDGYDAVRALYDGLPGHPVVLGPRRAGRRRRVAGRPGRARAARRFHVHQLGGRAPRHRRGRRHARGAAGAVRIEHTFEVQRRARTTVFAALNDLELVVPCLPGARITGRDDDGVLPRRSQRRLHAAARLGRDHRQRPRDAHDGADHGPSLRADRGGRARRRRRRHRRRRTSRRSARSRCSAGSSRTSPAACCGTSARACRASWRPAAR